MLRPSAALLCAFALTACATAPPAPLPLTELARGQYGPCTSARREVVRDHRSWELAWSQAQSMQKTPPPVSFDGQLAIVVCLGERRSGGHAIEVAAVELTDEELVVTVRSSAPAPGAITTQALTAPYHIVRVARTTKPVRWVELR